MQAGIDLCQLPLERKKILAYLQKAAFCSWQVSLKIHGCSRPSEIGKAEGSSLSVKIKALEVHKPLQSVHGGRGRVSPAIGGWRALCCRADPSKQGCTRAGRREGSRGGPAIRSMAKTLRFSHAFGSKGAENTDFPQCALDLLKSMVCMFVNPGRYPLRNRKVSTFLSFSFQKEPSRWQEPKQGSNGQLSVPEHRSWSPFPQEIPPEKLHTLCLLRTES